MRIGDAAARLGTEPHVLRHWEEAGVLVPRRLGSGHRDYDEDSLGRARLIRVAQGAGMSLAEIRGLAAADWDRRRTAIAGHRDRLRRQMTLLQAVDGFLAHVGDCVHPVLSDCPDCSAFVTSCESAPSRRHGTRTTPLSTAPPVTG
jgi:DNA-binding transcriptional MerR regulator